MNQQVGSKVFSSQVNFEFLCHTALPFCFAGIHVVVMSLLFWINTFGFHIFHKNAFEISMQENERFVQKCSWVKVPCIEFCTAQLPMNFSVA